MGKYWPLRQILIIRYINSLNTAFQVDHTCQREGFFWVSLIGSTSPSALLPCGVPQGSILGPIHFIFIFSSSWINPEKIWHLIHFYADDSQILPRKGNDGNSLSLIVI